jgi:exo-beta-1,3-glucanase (GH17 family)
MASLFVMLIVYALPSDSANKPDENNTMIKRVFNPEIDGVFAGNGISYGAYRDGESPDKGSLTSKVDILEDLRLISNRWNLIRLYGSDRQAENILEVIKENNLPIRVMQGAWLGSNQTREINDAEIETLIRLANRFPDIIVAANVGNEIFVDWSAHRIEDMKSVISYIRRVRSQITQPVTVVDDYNFWNKPQAGDIAKEIDFIGLNAYAFWNNKLPHEAMTWTESIYRDIQARYPGHVVAYTETGWPTSRVYDDGSYEGTLTGKAGEEEQCLFFEQYNEWVNNNGVISFYFEAFDENWKGGFDGKHAQDKAEKHWGVYRADRTPKKLLSGGRCDLKKVM